MSCEGIPSRLEANRQSPRVSIRGHLHNVVFNRAIPVLEDTSSGIVHKIRALFDQAGNEIFFVQQVERGDRSVLVRTASLRCSFI
jgi:hypothetical protein